MAKAGYASIDGTARKIKSIYVSVNGVARKVKSAYIGVDGKARQWYSVLPPILASDLTVGQSVYLNWGGSWTEYLVVNQGRPQGSSYYDDSCNGTWLLSKDCPVLRQINSTGLNNWSVGEVSSYLDGDFYNSFDNNAKSAIKQVKIPYVASGSSTSIRWGSNGLSRRVFPLSGTELGTNHVSMLEEGARLTYFTQTTVASEKRVSNWNGVPVLYWTRSPRTDGTTNTYAIGEKGELTEARVTDWKGVRPALILPFTATFDPATMRLIG